MRTGIATAGVLLCLAVANDRWSAGRAQSAPSAPAAAGAQSPAGAPRALIDQYCQGCHNDRIRSGGLALSQLNLDAVGENAEIAEKVIRKLRGGLMPPAGARRPDRQAAAAFVSWLETKSTPTRRFLIPGVCPCVASIAGSTPTPSAI